MARILRTLSWVFLVFVIGGTLQDRARTAERRYAPDRKADILHITIDVTPNFKQRTVAGTTTITFSLNNE